MAERTGTWDGGYIHKDARGRDVYVIRQQVGGKRYEVSTRAFSVRAALDQLKRFQANPEGYDPRGDVRADPIYIDKELVEGFLTYSRHEKENTPKWVREQRKLLSWWSTKLRGVDLRGASLRDAIMPALDRATQRHHKVAVLKGLYSWLRTVKHQLELGEDPTAAGGLKVPQAEDKLAHRGRHGANKAVSREQITLVRKHLMGGWRDALDLQAETGWHVTEVQRFTSRGDIELATPAQREAGVAGVLIVQHKSGAQHRTGVSAKTLEVAQRLRKRGAFSTEWYHRAVKAAGKAAGLKKPFGPGVMRHSVATWAVDEGHDLAMVSTFLGHRSPLTTRRFYATHATPRNPMLPTPPAAKPKRRSRSAR
jgi:integrase